MFDLTLPWWEFVVRAIVIYLFLLALLRMSGKRQIGQLATFDLVLLLVLANSVQNAMNGGDNSLAGGIILATTLVALNVAVSYLTQRNRAVELFIDGRPEVLIHNGRLFESVMEHAKITRHEINAALRQAGVASPDEVHTAILENNGTITVTPKVGRNGDGRSGDPVAKD